MTRRETGWMAVLAVLLVASSVGVRAMAPSTDAPAPPPPGRQEEPLDLHAFVRIDVTPELRAAGLRFGKEVPRADRRRVARAVARARPQAAALLAEVDGVVDVVADPPPPPRVLGATGLDEGRVQVRLDLRALRRRPGLLAAVVMHELGHVVDLVLVPEPVGEELDIPLPGAVACEFSADPNCDPRQERFADSFMKWALGGRLTRAAAPAGSPGWRVMDIWAERLTTLVPATDPPAAQPGGAVRR